jgi:AhpD family alkylhydroperoxidase
MRQRRNERWSPRLSIPLPEQQQLQEQPVIDPVNQNDPAFMATYDQQYELVWQGGAIPAKYKELTGIALSLVGRCESCLRYHLRQAIQAGATRAEIVEMVRLSLIAGGSTIIPTARYAYSMLEELQPNG